MIDLKPIRILRCFILPLAVALIVSCEGEPQDKVASYQTHYEASGEKETATYAQTIDFYMGLARDFPQLNIHTIGKTDSGQPLHMVTFNPEGDFNFENIRKDKAIILINNGIHPGESDGMDATMMLYRDLVTKSIPAPEHTVLVTIPVYNIGGALNRNSTSRLNQNGPLEYGFRGNALNYDLNRDFIKMDSRNARTFADIYHLIKPDVFLDNHVSNGADYQYTLTHLFTQHNKMGGTLGQYLHDTFRPALEGAMAQREWDITPYVNVFNRPPELGFDQFMDHPRYSTGYTTLWNSLGLMLETHMLKPYKQRVEGAYELMVGLIDVVEKQGDTLKSLRREALKENLERTEYYFNWVVDTTQSRTLAFKGFEVEHTVSAVTGLPRLKYDRERPYTKETPYRDEFYPRDTVSVPDAYIIGQSHRRVMERLDANKIDYFKLNRDTTLEVEAYEILDYRTGNAPYEGHYLHYNTEVEGQRREVRFRAGDFVVPTAQPGIRYLMETLEPIGPDSFFNWNFFDTHLQRKEGYSPYVFEDLALEILEGDSLLRQRFETKKKLDLNFAHSSYAQLDWIYRNSKYRETAHMAYPVYRVLRSSAASEYLLPKK